MLKIFHRNDRVVGRRNDGRRDLNGRKVIAVDAIGPEIGWCVRVIGKSSQQQVRHFTDRLAAQDIREIIALREKRLLAFKGLLPFFHEIGQQEGVAVDPVRGLVRVENRADADDLLQGAHAVFQTASGNSQGKVAPQRKSHQKDGGVSCKTGCLFDGPIHFLQPGGIKKALVQMVAVAVVPVIEPEYVVMVMVEIPAAAQDIGGIGTAFPAVQQDAQPLARFLGYFRINPRQADAVPGIEDYLRRHDQVIARKIPRQLGGDDSRNAALCGDDGDGLRPRSRRTEMGHDIARAQDCRGGFDPLAPRQRDGVAAGCRDFPQVAAVDVTLVAVVVEPLAVSRHVDVLDDAVPGHQIDSLSTLSREGVDMRPVVILGEEEKSIVGRPVE